MFAFDADLALDLPVENPAEAASSPASSRNIVRDWLPFAWMPWRPLLSSATWRGDAIAGLTVGVMLVPQGMAYAMLAGLPPVYGLYASLIPLILYPLLGTARHVAIGTVAVDSLLILAGTSMLAEPGTQQYIGYVMVLALLVGVIQIGMGLLRLGFVVNLLSRPVLTGFTSAAALTIAGSQLGPMLGLQDRLGPTVWDMVVGALGRMHDWHVPTIVVGVVAVFLLRLLKRFAHRLPAPLVLVLLGILASVGLSLPAMGVSMVGEVPAGLPSLALPVLSWDTIEALFPTAITLALVQFMSLISLGKLFAAKHRYRVEADQELVAIGVANLAGSFARSMPVSASFSRSAVNEQAGAATPLANVFAALVIGLTALIFTPAFTQLPVPILSAIIVVAVWTLIDIRGMRFLTKAKRVDGIIAVITFFVTLVVGVQQGILTGIAASVVAIMYRISRPRISELGHIPGTRSFRELHRNRETEPIPDVLLLRVDASFSFANATYVEDRIFKAVAERPDLKAVILDGSSVNDLDTTAAATLFDINRALQLREIAFLMGGFKLPVLATLRACQQDTPFTDDQFFLSPHRAVLHVLESTERATYLDHVPSGMPTDPAEPVANPYQGGAQARK